ncbi:ATP-binding protein [Pseudalkalibacillus hwajinpoensis]|uniref:ATP-binding protein n=1 Tax=Guptibacillus hwajinpoensis TaxID=208199 RepID=UPI00325A7245
MRDGKIIPLGEEYLVITSDNSGGIGRKEKDVVPVPYETVSYFAFRVAVMECMALGATPISVVMHNFCGDSEWKALVSGVERGIQELGLSEISITGSSETNMPLLQSALGVVVIGKMKTNELPEISLSAGLEFAVIGKPLVGEEVVMKPTAIAPLELFRWICEQEGVRAVLPVGSKGILYELNQLVTNETVDESMVQVDLDIYKSGGPSTCFIMAYQSTVEEKLSLKIGPHFHPIGGQTPV